MTATQMLTEGLNAALRRPVVNSQELRKRLIQQGRIRPAGRWVYVPSPNGNGRGARLVWQTTRT